LKNKNAELSSAFLFVYHDFFNAIETTK